jgi:hypothetical protein
VGPPGGGLLHVPLAGEGWCSRCVRGILCTVPAAGVSTGAHSRQWACSKQRSQQQQQQQHQPRAPASVATASSAYCSCRALCAVSCSAPPAAAITVAMAVGQIACHDGMGAHHCPHAVPQLEAVPPAGAWSRPASNCSRAEACAGHPCTGEPCAVALCRHCLQIASACRNLALRHQEVIDASSR